MGLLRLLSPALGEERGRSLAGKREKRRRGGKRSPNLERAFPDGAETAGRSVLPLPKDWT